MQFGPKRVLFILLFWLILPSSAAAEGLGTFHLEIPPGKWKSARLRNLPRDAAVAVQVESSGEITVALVDSRGYQSPEISRPLFLGQVEKRLAFSVSIPAQDDYYLILKNRTGEESRKVTLSVRAAQGSETQARAAEDVLKKFELQVNRFFIFKPFPIGIKKCASPKAFMGASGLYLCDGYVYHLHDIIHDQQAAQNSLSLSLFHEISRILLAQWGHASAESEAAADELAVVLMVMFNQRERARAAANYFAGHPSVSETFSRVFFDRRHPLNPERARNILGWLTRDTELVLKWQEVLVPHMQTALLKKLNQQPTPWTDSSLVEKELFKRGGGKKVPA